MSKTKEITLLAACIAILFVQEQLLTFIPNFQFTTVLIIIYSRVLKFRKTSVIVFAHVLLDNIYMGSIGMPNIVIPMFIAWMLVPIIMNTFLRNTENIVILAIFGYLYGHIYGLTYVPFQAWFLQIDISKYILADIPFEIIMGISNLLTIIWLYKPLKKTIEALYNDQQAYTGL